MFAALLAILRLGCQSALAHLDESFLKRVFAEVGAWIYDATGIEVPADQQEFEIYQNPRGKLSCQGKISYKGPVSPTRPFPRIKLDLTADEHVVLSPVTAEIFHPYSDMPEEGITPDLSRRIAGHCANRSIKAQTI